MVIILANPRCYLHGSAGVTNPDGVGIAKGGWTLGEHLRGNGTRYPTAHCGCDGSSARVSLGEDRPGKAPGERVHNHRGIRVCRVEHEQFSPVLWRSEQGQA